MKAEFLDPEVTSDQGRDLINTTRDGFLEDSPIVQIFNDWAQDFLRKIIQGVDESETKRRTDALLNHPAIKERLDRMPAHVRGTATKVVRGILVRLKNVADPEAQELIEWILRYYESNILRELMRAIIAADMKDAERVAELVEDWGVRQVNSVVEIIKSQIDIIGKLEELVAQTRLRRLTFISLLKAISGTFMRALNYGVLTSR